MRDMFDAIAPRYDLVNRIMTFRLDVRWRRRAVRSLALPPASRILDLASGTGDLCLELAAAGYRAVVGRPQPGDAQGRPQRRAAGAGRHPAPARARRLRRRRDVRVRPAQPRRPRPVLRRARSRRAARAGGSPCSTSGSPTTGSSAGATASTSARSSPASAGWLSDPAAYRYLPRSVAYLPPAGRHAGHAAPRRGSPTPPTPSSAAASPSCSAAPATADARRHPPRRRRHRGARPQRHRQGRRLPVRARRRRAGRPGCRRPGVDRRDAGAAGVDRARRPDRRRRRRPGPVAIGWVPYDPARAGRADRAGGDGPQDGRRPPAGHRRSTTPSSASPAPHAAEPVGVGATRSSRSRRSTTTSPPWRPTRDAVRDGRLTKAVIAREIAVTADRPIDRHGVLQRLKASFGSSYRYAVDGLHRRVARAARRGRRPDGPLAPAGRHGAALGRRHRWTRRSPPR